MLSDLNNGLEGRLINVSKEIHMCDYIDASVAVYLEVVHLLENLCMASNIGLEVVTPEPPIVIDGAQLGIKLFSITLGQTRSNKHSLKLLESGTKVLGLAKLVNAYLGGVLTTFSFQGSKCCHDLEDFCIYPFPILITVPVNRDDEALPYHHEIKVPIGLINIIDVLNWNNFYYVEAQGS